MRTLQRLCVFCGSSAGSDPVFADSARALGAALAAQDVELVYGGGSVGLMGELARAVMAAGGRVIGVIPRHLAEREVALTELDDLRVVDSMHARKALMADLADAFVALPGGIGTLEEFIEVLTWAQLGLHDKPCGLLNTAGYFDTLLRFLDEITAAGFMALPHRGLIVTVDRPAEVAPMLRRFQAPQMDKADWARNAGRS